MPQHYRSEPEQCIDVLKILLGHTKFQEKLARSRLAFTAGLVYKKGMSLIQQLHERGLIAFEKKGRFTYVSKTEKTHLAIQKYQEAIEGLGLSGEK